MRRFGQRVSALLLVPSLVLGGSCSSERAVEVEAILVPRTGGAPPATLPDEVKELREAGLAVDASDLVGAIPGSSSVSPVGVASYVVPIDVAPGPNGMAPSLAIAYSSAGHGGNGPLGVGFDLAGLSSIRRCNATIEVDGRHGPVQWLASDPICLDGRRLILFAGTYGADGSEYRPAQDPATRVVLHGSLQAESSWFEVFGRDGKIASYGGVGAQLTRQMDPIIAIPYGWAIDEQRDRFGNTIDYQYESLLWADDSMMALQPSAIAYGGTGTEASRRHVRFDYEVRPDTPGGYFHGARYGHARRLREISVEGPNAELIYTYGLRYDQHPRTGRSILRSLTKYDRFGQPLPETTFEWGSAQGDALHELFFTDPAPEYVDGVLNADVLLSGDFDGNLEHELIYWSGDGSSPASHNMGGQVPVSSGDLLAEHSGVLDLTAGTDDFGAPLGPSVIRFDPNAASDLLRPSRPVGSGRDVFGHPFAAGFSVSMGYGGADFNLGWVESEEDGRIYQMVPADHDGDGITDIWVCRGAGHKTAEWILFMDRPPEDASGSLTYDEHPTGIGCSSHDETLVLPLEGGTRETLLVVPAYPTELATQPQPDWLDYADGDDRIPESERDEYLALRVSPGFAVASLEPSGLPRDLYQRWHDRDCLNGVTPVADQPPVHGAGPGRDRLIDVNGDGFVDVLRFELDVGDDYPSAMTSVLTGLWPTYDEEEETFGCDETIATTTGGRVRVYINTGEGFLPGTTAYDFPGIAHVNFWANWMGGFVHDLNADGLQDVYMPGGGHGTGPDWTVLVSNGDGTFDVQSAEWNEGNGGWPGYLDDTTWQEDFAASARVGILTIAGDVVPNFVFMGADIPDHPVFEAVAELNQAHGHERVLRVTDGLGLETEFAYWYASGQQPPQIYPRLSMTRPRGVAAFHRVGELTTQYQYATGVEDAWGSGFLGWERRTAATFDDAWTDPMDYPYPGEIDRVLVERYDYSREPGVPGYPFSGGPVETDARVEVDLPSGGTGSHVACTTITDTEVLAIPAPGGTIVRAYPAATETVRAVVPGESPTEPATDCDDILLLHRYHESISTQTQDAYGTPLLRETSVVGGDTVTEELLGVTNDTSAWLLGQPASRVVQSCTAQLECESRTTEFDWNPVTGALDESVREPGDGGLYLRTVLGYDAHGNVNAIDLVDALGVTRSSASQHDPEGVNPEWADDAIGHRRYFVHDPATGFRYGVVDPEGVTVYQRVDGFMRPVRSELRSSPMGAHDGNPVDMQFLAGVSGSAMRVRESEATGQVVTTDMDARGLTTRRSWRGMADATPASLPAIPAGNDVYQKWTYDAYGNRLSETLPAWDGTASAGERVWTYDALDRVTSETGPAPGTVTTWQYFQGADAASFQPGTETTITDPDKRVLVLEHDTNQHLVRVRESVDAHMCQTWGPFDRIELVERNCAPFATGPQTATDYDYDAWNRLTGESDPAFGDRVFGYDAFGNLRTRTDGNASTTTYVPDALGRVVERIDGDGTARWTYDTLRLGSLTSMRTADGVTNYYTYDAFNRVLTERETFRLTGTVTNVSALFRYTYGPGGRVNTVQYPTHSGLSAFTIQRLYDAAGYERAVRKSTGELYWMAGNADPSGGVTLEYFGNDAVTERDFDNLTLRPSWIRTTSPPHDVQYLEYRFTPGGDLDSRSAPQLNLNEEFKYDYAHRLTNATVSVPPLTYSTDLEYDVLGNVLGKTGIGDYKYDEKGQLESVGTLAETVLHDPAGRVEEFGKHTLAWSPRDMLRQVSEGGVTLNYRYDAAENRVSRQQLGGAEPGFSVKFGDDYEALYGATGSIRQVIYRVASATGRVISERRHAYVAGAWTAAAVKYVHDDHLGSGSAQTDAAGNPVEHVAYDPWGAARDGENWGAAYTGDLGEMGSGFTGHQAETELGLINMRGRMYHPQMGRFMSADPIVSAPEGIQGWNRYSYVGNRPLVFTDPTGWERSWHQVQGTKGDLLMMCDSASGGFCVKEVGVGGRSGFDLQDPLGGGGHIGEIMAESGMYVMPGGGVRGGIPGADGIWSRGAQDMRAGDGYAEYLQQMRAHQSAVDSYEDAQLLKHLARPGGPNALQNLAAGAELLDKGAQFVVEKGAYVNPVLGAMAAGIALGDDFADDGSIGVLTALDAFLSAKGLGGLGKAAKGAAGGARAGKPFTPKGKAEIDAANAGRNGGKNVCENCGADVVPGQRSQRGVSPPRNERQRDHIIPKSRGGDGSPPNGQILCRACNLDKGNNL